MNKTSILTLSFILIKFFLTSKVPVGWGVGVDVDVDVGVDISPSSVQVALLHG
jgi:hypothetical protein